MSKFSKKINGSVVKPSQTNLHATPVAPSAPSIVGNVNVIVNNAASALDSYGMPKLPILGNMAAANIPSAVATIISKPITLKEWGDPNTTLEPINSETVAPPENQRIFSTQTGLLESEPVVIVSSEFQPLFTAGANTSQGKALRLKENSKLLTAKTSISLLSQNADVAQLLQENKNQLKQYAESGGEFVSQLLRATNSVLSYMDLSSYAIPVQRNPSSVGSLYEILKKSGYNTTNIINYTETKLWQQSLLEIKRNLTAHTQHLTTQNFTRSNVPSDASPFELSDVENSPAGYKKIWMNPAHVALPTVNELTNTETLSNSLVAFSEFDKKKYVNLSAGNSIAPAVLSSDLIDTFAQSGKDITITANCVLKELSYSNFIGRQNNVELLSTKYGYTVSSSGDNFRVWDYVIGRFPKKITDFVPNPTGNGNSLVSFSQRIATPANGNGTLNILTFENNTFEDFSITPGSVYYIDSTLSVVDGNAFSTSRLDDLINLTRSAHETTKVVLDMLSYEILPSVLPIEGVHEVYEKKNFSFDTKIENVIDRFTAISDLYKSCIEINNNQFVKLNTNALVPGFKLTTNETIGVRLASLICKLAVYPTVGYSKISSRIKTLLFLWLMNVAIKMSNPSVANDALIFDAKKRIASYIGSVKANINSLDLEKAMWTARTLLVTTDLGSTINAEQTETNSVVRERKAAASSYAQAVFNKIFEVDSNKGIWKILVDALRSVYENQDIYVNNNTAYSGLSKTAFLYNYFDMLLRIVASQTPENILGMYSITTPRSSNSRNDTGNFIDTGILISEVSKQQLEEYYNVNLILSGNAARNYVNKLSDTVSIINVENNTTLRQVALVRKYFADLGLQLNIFRNYLRDTFITQVGSIRSLYQNDASLTQNQRDALLSLSLSEEQLRLSRYITSEMIDRIEGSTNAEPKLKSLPAFADVKSGFMDYMPVNEMELVSYSMLSPYFRSNEFLTAKGNNKRILSIGIPPRLIRSIHTMSRSSANLQKSIRQGIVRIKIYKLDRLHPDVVFLPKSFIFEMHRYPTRRIANWDISDNVNVLSAPSKIVLPNGKVELHKNFNEAYPESYYENLLTLQERYQTYSNHTVSFLCEEYLRWFTDCKFDESQYNNFSPLTQQLEFVTNQYNNFVAATRPNAATSITEATQQNNVVATFLDNTSNEVFVLPIGKPTSDVPKEPLNTESSKTYVLPLNETIRSYFLNETFILNPEIYKKRISYLKKFDRVFNVIIDPDDFYVDVAMTPESTLKSMKQLGILTGGVNDAKGTVQPYKHRDTSPNDIFFNEYFVTVEPYDYVQEEA